MPRCDIRGQDGRAHNFMGEVMLWKWSGSTSLSDAYCGHIYIFRCNTETVGIVDVVRASGSVIRTSSFYSDATLSSAGAPGDSCTTYDIRSCMVCMIRNRVYSAKLLFRLHLSLILTKRVCFIANIKLINCLTQLFFVFDLTRYDKRRGRSSRSRVKYGFIESQPDLRLIRTPLS